MDDALETFVPLQFKRKKGRWLADSGEFERYYCIYRSRNDATTNGLLGLLITGYKAAYWKQNPEWIEKNVGTPFDYVQINHETWRLRAKSWRWSKLRPTGEQDQCFELK